MSRTFRYQEIADQLRADIAHGVLMPGALLPSESELSAAHDVSRVTVRKALEELRDQGVVGSRQGFGWFVEGDPLRQSLESLATIEAQLVDAGRTSERRVLEFRFVDAPDQVAPLLGGDVLEVVRLNLADDEPFALVTVWCPAAFGATLSRREVTDSSFVDLLGDRVGPARQVISAALADANSAALLQVDEGAALLRLWRVTSDQAGASVLVSEHLYPAHQTEFEVTLHAARPRSER